MDCRSAGGPPAMSQRGAILPRRGGCREQEWLTQSPQRPPREWERYERATQTQRYGQSVSEAGKGLRWQVFPDAKKRTVPFPSP